MHGANDIRSENDDKGVVGKYNNFLFFFNIKWLPKKESKKLTW